MTETRFHALKSETRQLAEGAQRRGGAWWEDDGEAAALGNGRFFVALGVVVAALGLLALLLR